MMDDNIVIEDNIEPPIPSFYDKLIDDEMDGFEKFKQKILSDKSIDKDMKQILIKSRLEAIKKPNIQSKNNIENAIRLGLMSPIIVKLKQEDFNRINLTQKQYVLNQIDDWIENKIQIIKLESETLYEIYQLVDFITSSRIDVNGDKIKKVFEPKNTDDYIQFIDLMEIINAQSIKEEEERIKNKMKETELEEKKIIQINERKTLIEKLLQHLNKLSLMDNDTKILKNEIQQSINDYLNLNTNFINVDTQDLSSKFIKFINSVRIEKENREKIISLIKIN